MEVTCLPTECPNGPEVVCFYLEFIVTKGQFIFLSFISTAQARACAKVFSAARLEMMWRENSSHSSTFDPLVAELRLSCLSKDFGLKILCQAVISAYLFAVVQSASVTMTGPFMTFEM